MASLCNKYWKIKVSYTGNENLINKIKKVQQQQHNRFHAVPLSNYGKPSIMKIFDHIWRFDTGLKSRLLRRWRQ